MCTRLAISMMVGALVIGLSLISIESHAGKTRALIRSATQLLKPAPKVPPLSTIDPTLCQPGASFPADFPNNLLLPSSCSSNQNRENFERWFKSKNCDSRNTFKKAGVITGLAAAIGALTIYYHTDDSSGDSFQDYPRELRKICRLKDSDFLIMLSSNASKEIGQLMDLSAHAKVDQSLSSKLEIFRSNSKCQSNLARLVKVAGPNGQVSAILDETLVNDDTVGLILKSIDKKDLLDYLEFQMRHSVNRFISKTFIERLASLPKVRKLIIKRIIEGVVLRQVSGVSSESDLLDPYLGDRVALSEDEKRLLTPVFMDEFRENIDRNEHFNYQQYFEALNRIMGPENVARFKYKIEKELISHFKNTQNTSETYSSSTLILNNWKLLVEFYGAAKLEGFLPDVVFKNIHIDNYTETANEITNYIKSIVDLPVLSKEKKKEAIEIALVQISRSKATFFNNELLAVKEAMKETTKPKLELLASLEGLYKGNESKSIPALLQMSVGNGGEVRGEIVKMINRLFHQSPQSEKQLIAEQLKRALTDPTQKTKYLALDLLKNLSPHDIPANVDKLMDIYDAGLKESWKSTDPNKHSSKQFQYFVHGFDPLRNGGFYPEDAFKNPEKFVERKYICTSVIDQDHLGSFRPTGVILETPTLENIVGAYGSDAGSNGQYLEKSLQKTGKELLDETKCYYGRPYNEVILYGTHPYSKQKTKIVGVFIFEDASDRAIEAATEFANQQSLPIVRLGRGRNWQRN